MNTIKDNCVIEPYLFFNGRCEEAVEFYREALGAEVEMMIRYKECPEPPPPDTLADGYEDKIMHVSFRIGATTILASDGCGSPNESVGFQSFSLALSVASEADAQRIFAALADGGQVTMPQGKTFWSPCFGMLEDRFGLGWTISVPGRN